MKILFTFVLALFLVTIAEAQVPHKMSYQAVIRDAEDNLIIDKSVGIRVQIIQGSENGSAVYTETHVPTTNMNGLVTFQIGTGDMINGEITDIDWANGPYFIKTETDPTGGTDYSIEGVSELLSVPYALYSLNGEPGPQGPQGPQGEQGPEGPQGPSGSGSTFGTTNYISKFTPNDSTLGESQIFDDGTYVGIGTDNPQKKLDVSEDILINGVRVGRGNGGVATSTVLGFNSLENNSGADNTALGAYALQSNTSGLNNVAVGTEAMRDNLSSSYSVAVGWRSMENIETGTRNTAFGATSLQDNTSGEYNTAVGGSALARNISSSNNTAVGYRSVFENTTGENNTGVGYNALYNNKTGSNNTLIGANADVTAIDLTNATAIGANASVGASNSLVLGNDANVGIGTSTPTTKLHIVSDASQYNHALFIDASTHATSNRAAIGIDDWFILQDIIGDGTKDFAIYQGSTNEQRLVIGTDGNVGIGTSSPSQKLSVEGNSYFNGKMAIGYEGTPPSSFYFDVISDASKFLRVFNFDGALVGAWGNEGTKDGAVVRYRGLEDTQKFWELGQLENNSFTIRGGNNANLHILENGNVGIGTENPSSKLEVIANESNNYTMKIQNTANTNTSNGLSIWAGGSTSGYLVQFIDNSSGVEHGTIRLVPAGVNYITSSDARLKTNIVNTEIGLDALDKISIKDYEFIDRAQGQTFQGIIAQELWEIYPQAVNKGTDELNEKGLPVSAWGIDYGKLTPLIIKSIQEMNTTIVAQQAQIEAQQKQIDKLIELLEAKK